MTVNRRRGLPALIALAVGAALLQAVVVPVPSSAAAGDISTYAGGLGRGAATNVGQQPGGVAAFGTKLYVADTRHRVVRMVETSTGEETVIAGPLDSPDVSDNGISLAVNGAGTLYVAHERKDQVVKVVVQQNGSTGTEPVAGTGTRGFSGDGGSAAAAKLFRPAAIAFDAAGNLYIADRGNERVRRVDTTGNISTYANFSVTPDTAVQPVGLAVRNATSGPVEVFVSARKVRTTSRTAIYKVETVGGQNTITPFAGAGQPGFSGDDGPAALAQLNNPTGLAVLAGELYIADTDNNRVRKVDTSGNISTYAGNSATPAYGGDCNATTPSCPATSAQLDGPLALGFLDGALYIADTGNNRVRKVAPAPDTSITTVAGNGELTFGGDGEPAASAQLSGSQVATAPGGVVYIADTGNHRVRKVGADGVISTIAGTGVAGDTGDCTSTVTTCPATSATLKYPAYVVVGGGDLYISTANRVRKVDLSSGRITAFAGTGAMGSSGDNGPATLAKFNSPSGMAVDASEAVFIADRGNNRVRKVAADGIVTTYAGGGIPNYGTRYGGDCSATVTTCPATSAALDAPWDVAVDKASGYLYIADTGNQRIRVVDPASAKITTVAGTGSPGYTGDGGDAIAAKLNAPRGVDLDDAGNLFIADTGNGRVRRVNGGIISTYAGTGSAGFSGDGGPATSAQLNPVGVAVDATGALYVADGWSGTARVRRIVGPDSALQVAPDTAFGDQSVGTASEARTTTLTNAGTAALAVGAVSVVGEHAGEFSIASDGCGATTLAGGTSCGIAVRFAPMSGGARRADLRLDYDSGDSPRLVPLSGIGLSLGVEPFSGPVFGGTKVVVVGQGLDKASAVRFGEAPAFSYRVDSPAQITAVSPPHALGPVDLVVAGPGGDVIVKGRFTFVDSSWSPTASLPAMPLSTNGRSAHTATPLANGKVLVAGGAPCPGCAAMTNGSAVLYDPSTRTWSPAAEMKQPRSRHTATRLSNGKVLVVGGRAGSQGSISLDSAELYDPLEDTWTLTGKLTEPRFDHTATLLANGDVLVAGGVCWSGSSKNGCPGPPPQTRCDYPEPVPTSIPGDVRINQCRESGVWPLSLKSAELYRAGSWTLTGQMFSAHTSHSASLLATGKVLVAGGWRTIENAPPGGATPREVVNHVEIYDPASKTWTSTAALDSCQPVSPSCVARQSHSATLLGDGRVLVSGGHNPDARYATRAASGQPGFSTAQIYDPDDPDDPAGSWSPAGSMREGRASHTAVSVDTAPCGTNCGKVLVAGGTGRCLVWGNNNQCHTFAWLGTAEIYDPQSNSWSPGGAMRAARSHASATALADGSVLVVAGAKDIDRSNASAELYRPMAEQPPVTITGVEPGVGPTFGNEVTFTGSGLFSSATTVRFGELEGRVGFVSDSELTATAPAQAQGTVPVRLSTPRGAATSEFAYGPGAWAPSGTMRVARAPAHMVALDGPACRAQRPSCGKVMVAGKSAADIAPNWSENDVVRPPELYDPLSGAWSLGATEGVEFDAIPALVIDGPACRRAGAPAPNHCGKILMYGYPSVDQTSTSVLRTFLWDPDTNAVSGITDARTLRYEATFSLLDGEACDVSSPPAWCGKLLLVGGNESLQNRKPIRSTEIYDPTQPQAGWTLTGDAHDLHHARSLHSATVLPSGEVLVAGGLGNIGEATEILNALSSAELYDPGSGKWTLVGSMAVGRFSHTATPLDRKPCGGNCGQVLVVGGNFPAPTPDKPIYSFVASAERYDPTTRTWHSAGLPGAARVGHSATPLNDGTVLVAGLGAITDLSAQPDSFPDPVSSAEIYDPVADEWRWTANMRDVRGAHAATLLGGPQCGSASQPSFCGKVLVAGGSTGGELVNRPTPVILNPTAQTELYTPAPTVNALLPGSGPSVGGTQVVITGAGFAPGDTVSFDGVPVPAEAVSFDSPTQLTVVSPSHRPGPAEVAVAGDGGTSAHLRPLARHMYSYGSSAVPAQVTGLVATAVSETEVELAFVAPADDSRFPTDGPPASRFVVKQSSQAIVDDAAFDAATSLCGGECTDFVPDAIGAPLSLRVTDLEPGTTYHFALRAVNDIGAGPASKPAWTTTFGQLRAVCQAVEAAAGQVLYGGGRYHLVGGPDETVVGSDSPLYSWFDQGAGGSYATGAGSDPLAAGRGYWSYSRCDRAVSPAGAGADHATFDLGAYHASMVANPSGTAPATLTGHDFSARWDPTLNGGAGGYQISAYREPQSLAVGEGIWAFSFVPAKLSIQT